MPLFSLGPSLTPSAAALCNGLLQHAAEPTVFDSLPAETIADKGTGWVARWTQVVLK